MYHMERVVPYEKTLQWKRFVDFVCKHMVHKDPEYSETFAQTLCESAYYDFKVCRLFHEIVGKDINVQIY